MSGEHAQTPAADGDRPFDKGSRGERAHLSVYEPRDSHPSREAEDRDHQRGAGLPKRREQEQQHHARQRQCEVGQSEQRQGNGSLPVAGDRADRDPQQQ